MSILGRWLSRDLVLFFEFGPFYLLARYILNRCDLRLAATKQNVEKVKGYLQFRFQLKTRNIRRVMTILSFFLRQLASEQKYRNQLCHHLTKTTTDLQLGILKELFLLIKK